MNHLAHFYLAGSDEDLNLGNYIADHIRGKRKKQEFSLGIQAGIKMHQQIDRYTDAHEKTRSSIDLLNPIVGRYSPVAIDVIYDHFLAKLWSNYSDITLQEFADQKYGLLEKHYTILPNRSQQFFQFMVEHNILYNYQFIDTLERVFHGMSRRTRFESNLDKSVQALTVNYEELERNFEAFFQELMTSFMPWEGKDDLGAI